MMRTLPGSIAAAAICAACLLQSSNTPAQTPEQEKIWEAQQAQALAEQKVKAERLAKERDARRHDPMAWVRTLDPMSSGGWEFRTVAADGSWAAYSTEHQLKRSGKLVSVWLRQEYAEPQQESGGDMFMSNVENVQYDCAKQRARALVVIYYSQNNIRGNEQSEQVDPKEAPWSPIVPGTLAELNFQWACITGNAKSGR
jgi:hypothetical protein